MRFIISAELIAYNIFPVVAGSLDEARSKATRIMRHPGFAPEPMVPIIARLHYIREDTPDEEATVYLQQDKADHTCYFCGKTVGDEYYCYGCGEYVCGDCGHRNPGAVGPHPVEDHEGDGEDGTEWG